MVNKTAVKSNLQSPGRLLTRGTPRLLLWWGALLVGGGGCVWGPGGALGCVWHPLGSLLGPIALLTGVNWTSSIHL